MNEIVEEEFRKLREHSDSRNLALKAEYLILPPEHEGPFTQAQEVSMSLLENVQLIHRGTDGYVCFTRKEPERPGEMAHVFSVKASELHQWLPQIAEQLFRDSYYSINSMFRPGFGASKVIPGLSRGERSSQLIRYLTCCFMDCDLEGTPEEQLLAALQAKRHAASMGIHVPEWSMIAHSGRGFWLFWLLRDHREPLEWYHASPSSRGDPFRPHRSEIGKPLRTSKSGRHIAAWNRCQRQLLRAFASVKADPNAADVARITRVPGSINSKNERRVAYRVNYLSNGSTATYTLDEMCAFLNVEPVVVIKAKRLEADPARSAISRKGRIAMLEGRMSKWVQLAELRGGYRPGSRNNALFIAAATLRMLRVSEEELRSRLEDLNLRYCSPPLNSSEVKHAVNGSALTRKLEDLTIGNRLGITPQESELVKWPYAGFMADPTIRGNRQAVKHNRRTLIQRFMYDRGGELLEASRVRELLEAQGIEASLRTVQLDLKELGLEVLENYKNAIA